MRICLYWSLCLWCGGEFMLYRSMSQNGMAGMLGWMCHTAKLCEQGTVKSTPAQLVHWKRVVDCLGDSVDFHKKGRVYCERKPEVTGPENKKYKVFAKQGHLSLILNGIYFIVIQFLLSVFCFFFFFFFFLISFKAIGHEMCENNFKS